MEGNMDLFEDEKLKKTTKELLDTQSQLADSQLQLISALKRAEKSERLYERALAYNEDLREQVDKLSKQLHLYKTKGKMALDKSSQTDASENQTQATCTSLSTGFNGDIADDHSQTCVASEKAGVSLAESLRETAEAAVENSGFVYDENTGLYYDYNSGYFYDNENSLYFDPPSGTYFYYDEDAKEYKFHSQVDMTHYDTNQSKDTSHHSHMSKNGEKHADKENDEELKRHSCKHKKRLKAKDDGDPNGGKRHSRKRKNRLKADDDDGDQHGELKKHSRKRKMKLKTDDVGHPDGGNPAESSPRELNQPMEILCYNDGQSHDKTSSADLENKCLKSSEEISQQSDNNNHSNSEEDDSTSNSESELESGELTDESSDSSHGDDCFENCNHDDTDGNLGNSVDEEALIDESNPGNYPPCIRVMVTQSDVCKPGTLFIVTYPGGVIGREGKPVICLPEPTVSKIHAEIRYLDEEKTYVVVDGGNQNGTFVNGTRISEARCAGDPHVLNHGDVIVIGSSHLLCHIHPGLDTCDLCEPGQVMANIEVENTQPKEIVILSKAEKDKLRRSQMKRIKMKYGLENMNYSDADRVPHNPAYTDKSEERRQTVGSDNPYQKTEAPASVHRQISTSNKGHQLLEKMGWTEGGGLGKHNHGIQEPVKVSFRLNKSAGLGSVLEQKTDMENASQGKYTEVWRKTQERFRTLENVSGETTGDLTIPAQTQWVTGETLQFGDSSNQQTTGSSNKQSAEYIVEEQNQHAQP